MLRAGRFACLLVLLIATMTVLWHALPSRLSSRREAFSSAGAGSPERQIALDLADPGQSYSYNYELMARVISAEAKGEPYIGQVAVGAVILNRVNHPHFPKTIPGVVFEPDAFTAVSTGDVWFHPVSSAFRAAEDALTGWDPTGGAVYYYNPAKATNWWVATRRFIVQIGRHIFLG